MDIHLNVLARPLPGHEAEFEELVDLLDAAPWGRTQPPNPYTTTRATGLFGWRKETVFDFDAANARFDEVSEPHYALLGAPVVGRDPEADTWLQQAVTDKEIDAKSDADALKRYCGLHVLDVLPACDGFPVYSAHNWDRSFDRACFYGTVLHACSSLIGDELVEYLHGPLLAPELAEWGDKLRHWADVFAEENQLTAILGDRDFVSDDDPDATLHIVDQMARWAAYWSSRGHGSAPFTEL